MRGRAEGGDVGWDGQARRVGWCGYDCVQFQQPRPLGCKRVEAFVCQHNDFGIFWDLILSVVGRGGGGGRGGEEEEEELEHGRAEGDTECSIHVWVIIISRMVYLYVFPQVLMSSIRGFRFNRRYYSHK